MATRKSIWVLFGTLVITAWILGFALPVQAEEFKCRLVSTVTKVDTHKVDDQEGHIVGTVERKGLFLHDNGEVANELNKVIFDRAKDVNKWQGYCLQTFNDGSTIMMKHQGTNEKGQYDASFEFIKGTGRFEGIKGQGTFAGQDYGSFNYLQFTGTYTLPKK